MSENSANKYREESDFLGSLKIPQNAYYGVHSARAKDNFQISGRTLSEFYDLVKALGMVKLASLEANHQLGGIKGGIYQPIKEACQDVIDLKYLDQFIVDPLQGGAGTSSNMNANEVIANRALEIMSATKGDYSIIHPNDHVNLSQSTNDVYPTAMRLALRFSLQRLKDELILLLGSFDTKSDEFEDVLKVGRTQLQDAVPMTLGQEFKAFSATLYKDINELDVILLQCLEVNLGGTAIGTGINTHKDYSELAIDKLSEISGFEFKSAKNLVEATWDTGAFLSLSSHLRRIATKLSKICNDLRLMSCGPNAGLSEITLPAVQAGSSIMPGKVNPVIPEAVNQVCFSVIGNDVTVGLASEAAQFQLNAFEPIMLLKIFESVRFMSNAMRMLRVKCIDGITANRENCQRQIMNSYCIATALLPEIGYEKVSELVKKSISEKKMFIEVLKSEGILKDDNILAQLDIKRLIAPNLT